MNHLTFREIKCDTADYRLACDLRQSVLRDPLGLQLTAGDVAADADQRHFGLFDGSGQITASLSAIPKSDGVVKFRQMAVDESFQGTGCGRNLITAAEGLLRKNGFVTATLHARITAASFYEKLGYHREGEEFAEVGIPHIQMSKSL